MRLGNLSRKFDDQTQENKVIPEMLNEIKKEYDYLKPEVAKLQKLLNKIKCERKKNNLILSGVCTDRNESMVVVKW